MKTIIVLLLTFVLLFGCKKEDFNNSDRVVITGKLPSIKSTTDNIGAVTKVLLFNVSGEHTLANITNGTFTVHANKDEPVGLIFTNADKAFLGYLKLVEGIASLPLNYLSDTVSVVNLGELTPNGSAFSSGKDILTQVMHMSTDQIRGYKYANINFSAAVENPDTDRNGVVDILEGHFYRLAYIYFGNGGTYTKTPSKLNAINLTQFRFMFFSSDATTPEGVTFSNLVGNSKFFTNYKSVNEGHTIYWSEVFPVNTPLNPECQILYNNKTLNFSLPDFSTTINNLVYIFPTLHYDNAGKLSKVSWVYYSGVTGSTLDATDASRIITDIIVQINNGTTRIYDSPNLGPEKQEIILSTPIEPSSMTIFYMACNDIFGNHIVVGYDKQ